MAGIEYEIVPALPLNAPKGKVPYIEDGGSLLGDSGFIVQYLKAKYKNLDVDLSESERALSLAMQRLLEEHLFWVTMYTRWQYTDANWQVNKQAIFGALPPPPSRHAGRQLAPLNQAANLWAWNGETRT